MRPEPSRARLRLAYRLAGIADDAGVGVRALAPQLGVSPGQVSKYRNGHSLPGDERVAAWLEACRVPAGDPARAEVEALRQEAHAESRPWFRGGHHDLVAELVRSARVVCSYQPTIWPGLLQTADYSRRVLEQTTPTDDAEIATALVRRAENQRTLYQAGRRFTFIVDERVTRRDLGGGPAVRAEQDARVASVSTLDTVEVLVLPDDVYAQGGGPFTIYDEPDEGMDAAVLLEPPHGTVTVDGPEQVQVYRDLFARLRHAARPL